MSNHSMVADNFKGGSILAALMLVAALMVVRFDHNSKAKLNGLDRISGRAIETTNVSK